MTNKKHPASGWIKHTPGQPRPVPVEWIKAVKDKQGWVFFASGKAVKPDGCKSGIIDWDERFNQNHYWDGSSHSINAITQYRIKKKYRRAYEELKENNTFNAGIRRFAAKAMQDIASLSPVSAPISRYQSEMIKSAVRKTISAYAKQQEQEMTRHNPGKETMTVTPESTITGIVSETIALSCTDSERTFTVNKTWYDKRRELIDHWLRGGEIELEYQLGKWRTASEFEVSPIAMTTSSSAYRIKPRQPVAGEVQVVDRIPYINVNGSGWHSLCGLNSISTLGYPDMESEIYPSVKAYIARQIWESNKDGTSVTEIAESLLAACN